MKLSIIIVSWNVRDLLKKCLESVFRHTKENTPMEDGMFSGNSAESERFDSETRQLETSITEVIVVDNGSSDGTVEMVQNDFLRHPELVSGSSEDGSRNKFGMTGKIKLIANKENLGFAAANNQGIREAKGEYVLLLNPDTEFIEDNTLSKCIAKMEQVEKIGVLGCQLLNSDGTIQPSVRAFPRVQDIIVILLKLHKLFPSLLDRYLAKDFFEKISSSEPSPYPLPERERELFEVDQVMGAFFCVRKELFDKIGPLDEDYFIWFEEVDFCRRAKQAGYKVVYWPGTSVIHHGGASFNQQTTLKKQWWFFKSALRYF